MEKKEREGEICTGRVSCPHQVPRGRVAIGAGAAREELHDATGTGRLELRSAAEVGVTRELVKTAR